MALKLRAQRPPTQGGRAVDEKAGQRGNAILPYLRAPVSFKRMLGGQGIGAAKAPEASGGTPRDELPQVIRKVAAQEVRSEVTRSREVCARGRKWIRRCERRAIRLPRGIAEIGIYEAERVAETRHGRICTGIRRWLAAGVEHGPPRGRAERGSAI